MALSGAMSGGTEWLCGPACLPGLGGQAKFIEGQGAPPGPPGQEKS